MLQFLSPLAFFAFAALLVPLAIHLLSRKSGKRIKVGSIQFLTASESHRLKSFRLNEVPLLLLRCALLIVLTLLLAQPHWARFARSSDSRGKVLIAPELLPEMNPRLQAQIDSLSATGHELLALAPNFPKLQESGELATRTNYWSLARELAQATHGDMPIWIFTSDASRSYRGERPALPENFIWQGYSASHTEHWLHAAKFVHEDSVQFLMGESTARQTAYSRFTAQLPALPAEVPLEGFPPVAISRAANGSALQLRWHHVAAHDDSTSLMITATPKTITIYFDEEHAGDRRYVQAALESATEFAAASWQVRAVSLPDNAASFARSDAVFWLSKSSLPKELEEHAANGALLITDAGAHKYHTVASAIMLRDFAIDNPPRLWRKTVAPAHGLELWREAQGEALLSAEPTGAGWHLHFQSRFHPQWTDLILHPMFPEMMLRLIERRDFSSAVEGPHDQRRLTKLQLQPQKASAATRTQATPHAVSLHLPLWILATILFAWERRLSERRAR